MDLDKVPVQTGAGVGLKGRFQQVGTLSGGEVIDLIGEVVKAVGTGKIEQMRFQKGRAIGTIGAAPGAGFHMYSTGSANVTIKWSFVLTGTDTLAPLTIYSLRTASLDNTAGGFSPGVQHNRSAASYVYDNYINSYAVSPDTALTVYNTGSVVHFQSGVGAEANASTTDPDKLAYFFNTKPINTFTTELAQATSLSFQSCFSLALNGSFSQFTANCTSV